MDFSRQPNFCQMLPPHLVLGAGWEGDQALTENHLRGRQINVDPGTQGQIMGAADMKDIHRWRVNVGVTLPAGASVPTSTAARALRFTIIPSVESDAIPRRLTVPLFGGQTVFVTGRALRIWVENQSAIMLTANYSIDDQATASMGEWVDYETFAANNKDEHILDLSPFCQQIVILQPKGTVVTLKGWNLGGTLVYEEDFATPNSGPIYVCPGLTYTMRTTGANVLVSIVQSCKG